jgi:hypothetical protein
MLERIKAVVGELSNPDWKKREQAAGQLRALGQGAISVLKDLRAGQPPETQKLIDTILKNLEQDRVAAQKAAAAKTAPAAAPQGGMIGQPQFDGPIQVQQELRVMDR